MGASRSAPSGVKLSANPAVLHRKASQLLAVTCQESCQDYHPETSLVSRQSARRIDTVVPGQQNLWGL